MIFQIFFYQIHFPFQIVARVMKSLTVPWNFNREANNNNDEKQMGISKRMSKSPEAFEKLEPIR